MRHQTLIVGSHFRPPAKQVLAAVPAGQRLQLVAEPDNPYDASAVKVMIDPLTIPEAAFPFLESELVNVGLTLEMLMSGGSIQLGYIPAQEGKPLAKARLLEPELLGNQQVAELMPDVVARLKAALDGSVRIELEETEDPQEVAGPSS